MITNFLKPIVIINHFSYYLKDWNKDKLNKNKFSEQEVYDRAKGFICELLKEGKVKQVFDEKTKRVKLII